jgi:hypothetical protein
MHAPELENVSGMFGVEVGRGSYMQGYPALIKGKAMDLVKLLSSYWSCPTSVR